MPINAIFNRKDFVRSPRPNQEGQTFMLSLDRYSIGINNSYHKETTGMSVIEKMIDVCLIHYLINSESS